MTSVHEAGHALVGLLTPESTPLYSVTILPRGGALGYTSFANEKEVYLMTKEMYEAQLDVSLGGRVAEELFFGKTNQGMRILQLDVGLILKQQPISPMRWQDNLP
jgi:ATP-dependent Zn protease